MVFSYDSLLSRLFIFSTSRLGAEHRESRIEGGISGFWLSFIHLSTTEQNFQSPRGHERPGSISVA